MVAPLGSTSWKPLSSRAFKGTLGQRVYKAAKNVYKAPLHPYLQPHHLGSLWNSRT